MPFSITPLMVVGLGLTFVNDAAAGGVFLFTYGGKITRFEATVQIPNPPTALQGTSPNWQIQATWGGMQPTDQSCVLQNVIGNAGSKVGHWSHIPSFYDGATTPNPTEVYFEKTQHEGDQVRSVWALDESSNKWSDTWSVVPGAIGKANGEQTYGGNYTFDGSKFNPKVPDMTEILLIIEHVGIGNKADPGWGSGPVTFTNIVIESVSTQDWCNPNNADTWHPQDVKSVNVSTPFTSTIKNGKKTCHIDYLVINSN
ncbi:hypothetical protein EYC84_006076 [Monilinia fructicola]|uniref:Uncharacterized protein n=1 Tax=Monilinia fructicola TaxID=38448 RepID=A0A5M9K2Z0_MONFR|nr:hypothetical protein EYC84_006076 [Monilinia fructicola]